MSVFQPFPKISRLSRGMIITEKIDGTNAHVLIASGFEYPEETGLRLAQHPDDSLNLVMLAGSRTRFITPKEDNAGFARWVQDHSEELWALGPGRHFGEWWGQKIQRSYGLTEKRFSLFNTSRWDTPTRPACCAVVPVLAQGTFDTAVVDQTLEALRQNGSSAAPGYMNPEGVVVFHTANGQLFKKTLEKDAEPKGWSSVP